MSGTVAGAGLLTSSSRTRFAKESLAGTCPRRNPSKNGLTMGRQWIQAKREVANQKKGKAVGKLVKEIMVSAKLGGADPASNARLFAAVEKARRQSATREVIERAIKKGSGQAGDSMA